MSGQLNPQCLDPKATTYRLCEEITTGYQNLSVAFKEPGLFPDVWISIRYMM